MNQRLSSVPALRPTSKTSHRSGAPPRKPATDHRSGMGGGGGTGAAVPLPGGTHVPPPGGSGRTLRGGIANRGMSLSKVPRAQYRRFRSPVSTRPRHSQSRDPPSCRAIGPGHRACPRCRATLAARSLSRSRSLNLCSIPRAAVPPKQACRVWPLVLGCDPYRAGRTRTNCGSTKCG